MLQIKKMSYLQLPELNDQLSGWDLCRSVVKDLPNMFRVLGDINSSKKKNKTKPSAKTKTSKHPHENSSKVWIVRVFLHTMSGVPQLNHEGMAKCSLEDQM